MVSKELRRRHEEKVRYAFSDLRNAVDNCSRETPRSVGRALDALQNAVDDKALYAEEQNRYKKFISDEIKKFEERCTCNLLIR